MENLNGRKLVEAGDLCERRNGLTAHPGDLKLKQECLKDFENAQVSFLFFFQEEAWISTVIGV